jgi:gliding motility-associated lipoprotein GldD
MRRLFFILFVVALCSISFVSCRDEVGVPKPYGYFRIALSDTAYSYIDLPGYPYTFRLSKNAYIEERKGEGEQYWINIQYPELNATIHCTYKKVEGNLRALSRDAQEFLYSHSTVASDIPMQEYASDEQRVYGLFCDLHGNTATPVQFYMTDSTEHFFRGSVYCNTIPNQDSLAPIYDYLRKDARVIMESMKWR